jgi:hypothetical protein
MKLSVKVINDMMESYNIKANNTWEKYGGIEIGAKGVKFTVIKVAKIGGSFKFVSLKDGSKNPQTVDLTDVAISKTADIVKAFMDTLLNNNVNPNNIYIAVSSGVEIAAEKNPAKKEALRQAIVNAVPNYKKDINFLDPCREGDLTIAGTLPQKVLYSSALIDIGSGNTKGGFRKKGQQSTCLSIPWGSVSFAKKFATKNDKMAAANKFLNDSISVVVNSEIQKDNDLTNRPYDYFTGGIIWAMCNYMHPGDVNKDFTDFTKEDVDKFLDLAINNYQLLIHPDLTRITDPELSKQIQKELYGSNGSVSVFNQDNIIAGAMILKSIVDQLDSNGAKRLIFIRYGSVGWISGYIVKNLNDNYSSLSE